MIFMIWGKMHGKFAPAADGKRLYETKQNALECGGGGRFLGNALEEMEDHNLN